MEELHLSHSNLDFMPDLSNQDKQTINLENNRISTIFSEYLPHTILKLLLGYNKIHSDGLPFEWPGRLESISLDHNYLQDSDGVRWPEGLKNLNLDSNPLKYWPEMLPSSLERLSMNRTDIRIVEPLPENLKQFHARSSRITQLPTSLPDRLEMLILGDNLLRSSRLPQHWGLNLKQLNLSGNSLKYFPQGLPDTLKVLWLDDNKITEIPNGLPANLAIFFIRRNKIRKIGYEKRVKPIGCLFVEDNELTESVSDYQDKTGNTYAIEVHDVDNWNKVNHSLAANRIRKIWRSYKIRSRLRSWRKTAIVKQELQEVSMHPSRAGRFENISEGWQDHWGC